jgi:hypothetical protein
MVENFLKLGRGLASLMSRQIGFSTDIDRIERKSLCPSSTQFERNSCAKNFDGSWDLVPAEGDLSTNRRRLRALLTPGGLDLIRGPFLTARRFC